MITSNQDIILENRKTILLVDDNAAFLKYFTKLLKSTSLYNILESSDVNLSLQLAKANTPDLILLDVLMPQKGGQELINDFRKVDTLSETPILFLTGIIDYMECDGGIKKIGTCYFLAKNTPSDSILKIIYEKTHGSNSFH